MSSPQKKDAINLDSDDDAPPTPAGDTARGKTSVVESPFGKEKSYTFNRNNYAEIYHVQPDVVDSTISTLQKSIPQPVEGVAIVVYGSASEYPFFKAVQDGNMKMINSSHVLNHRFDFQPYDEIRKGNFGASSYAQRCLIWVCKPHQVGFTKQNCEAIFKHWFQMAVDTKYIPEVKVPQLHPDTGYLIVKSWNAVIGQNQFESLYFNSYLSEDHKLVNPSCPMKYSSFKTCLRYNKNTLYSFFEPGHKNLIEGTVAVTKRLRDFMLAGDKQAYDKFKGLGKDTKVKTESGSYDTIANENTTDGIFAKHPDDADNFNPHPVDDTSATLQKEEYVSKSGSVVQTSEIDVKGPAYSALRRHLNNEMETKDGELDGIDGVAHDSDTGDSDDVLATATKKRGNERLKKFVNKTKKNKKDGSA